MTVPSVWSSSDISQIQAMDHPQRTASATPPPIQPPQLLLTKKVLSTGSLYSAGINFAGISNPPAKAGMFLTRGEICHERGSSKMFVFFVHHLHL